MEIDFVLARRTGVLFLRVDTSRMVDSLVATYRGALQDMPFVSTAPLVKVLEL